MTLKIIHHILPGLLLATIGCTTTHQVPVSIQCNSEKDEYLARQTWDRALAKLYKADSALSEPCTPARLSNPSWATRNRLKTYFGSDSVEVHQQVAWVIRQMKDKSSGLRYTIRIEDDSKMPVGIQAGLIEKNAGVVGYTTTGGPPVIVFNRRFLHGNPYGMPSVLLHELSHNAAHTKDFGYYRGGTYLTRNRSIILKEAELLQNADTYSEFISQF
jgi:hypothetical protein